MITKHVHELIAEANAVVETISPQEALLLKGQKNVQFIDIRDIRELWRDGKIEGAYHAPRGMLEFWVDPESDYYKEDIFSEENKLIFY